MDPMTLLGLAVALIKGGGEFINSVKEPDLTPEQIAAKKAYEIQSREFFDAYVAANPPDGEKPSEDP